MVLGGVGFVFNRSRFCGGHLAAIHPVLSASVFEFQIELEARVRVRLIVADRHGFELPVAFDAFEFSNLKFLQQFAVARVTISANQSAIFRVDP